MSKSLVWLAAGYAALTLPALACIQTMRLPKPGLMLPADLFRVHVHVSSPQLAIEIPLMSGQSATIASKPQQDPRGSYDELIAAFERPADTPKTFVERSDYAAALIYSGQAQKAVDVLLQIEKDFPGHYATASNLGTAYELAGDVDKALHWIKRGVAMNADSHDGTEWLHIAILETKQKLQKDPRWLATHGVIDDYRGQDNIEKALEYQLNERLYFIRENDPIMCDLFYEAAVHTKNPEKRGYFLRQVPRFGKIREYQVRKLLKS
jgi:tetratricopeptide (TPR) repeat protein